MELHIKDRIFIPQMLPMTTANFMDFNLKRSIAQKVALTEQDKTGYNIVEDREHNRITWDVEKDMSTPLIVDFTADETNFLIKSCENLPERPYPDDFWICVQKIYDTAKE